MKFLTELKSSPLNDAATNTIVEADTIKEIVQWYMAEMK